MLIDTHTHLYEPEFDADRDAVVRRALAAGVGRMLLPAIDRTSHERLFAMTARWPTRCLPMMGLHPTSINDNPDWLAELHEVKKLLDHPPVERFYAVGEVGLDLHWSRDALEEQCTALEAQLRWATEHDLPVVLHTRDAWTPMLEVLDGFRHRGLRGVFHAFSGDAARVAAARACGEFLFGIGGPVTYKKSTVAPSLAFLSPDEVVLETDAPYLPPAPYRGRRNESAYLPLVAEAVGRAMGLDAQQVARKTSANACRLFGIGSSDAENSLPLTI